jgi:hypothetical protein
LSAAMNAASERCCQKAGAQLCAHTGIASSVPWLLGDRPPGHRPSRECRARSAAPIGEPCRPGNGRRCRCGHGRRRTSSGWRRPRTRRRPGCRPSRCPGVPPCSRASRACSAPAPTRTRSRWTGSATSRARAGQAHAAPRAACRCTAAPPRAWTRALTAEAPDGWVAHTTPRRPSAKRRAPPRRAAWPARFAMASSVPVPAWLRPTVDPALSNHPARVRPQATSAAEQAAHPSTTTARTAVIPCTMRTRKTAPDILQKSASSSEVRQCSSGHHAAGRVRAAVAG